MNAAPISMNPAASAGDTAANAQSDRSSGLPGFAQVFAEKQSAPAAAKPIASSTNSAAQNALSSPDESQRQTKNAASSSPVAAAESQTASAATTGTTQGAPKKSDPKTKASDAAAKQDAAALAAIGALASLFGMAPAVLPVPLQITSVPPANSKPADCGKNAAPSAATSATPAAAASSNALPAQQNAQPATANPPVASPLPSLPLPNSSGSNAANPAAAPDFSVVTSANATQQSTENPNRALAQPSCAPTTSAGPDGPVVTPASVLASGEIASQAPPSANDLSSNNPANEPASPVPTAKSVNNSAKSQPGVPAAHKGTIAEIFRELVSAAGKTMDAVAHVSVTAAKDVIGAIKEKSQDANAAVPSVLSNAQRQSEAAANAKQDPSIPAASATPVTGNPPRNSSTSSDDTGKNDTTSGDHTSSNTDAKANTRSFTVDTGAPQPQSNAVNFAGSAAMGISASASAKESATSTKPATADAAGGNGAAPAETDESKLPSVDSKVINVAQFSGNNAHSQVRIAMQADELGQVELHATVSGQQVGAAITVEKKEAHAAMAGELPSLQQALEEKNLRVSEVVLMQSALHSTAGDAGNGGNAAPQQRPRSPLRSSPRVSRQTDRAGAGTSRGSCSRSRSWR